MAHSSGNPSGSVEQGGGPPTGLARPLLTFDGDCGFCLRTVSRWRGATGERVDYRSYQGVAARFPQVSLEQFAESVWLFEPDGRTTRAGEAVLRALGQAPAWRWAPWCYRRLPGVRPLVEAVYGFVAKRRDAVSRLDRLLIGTHVGGSTWQRSRRLFLAAVGVVALLATLSLWVQVDGLMGSGGIVPAHRSVELYRDFHGGVAWAQLPTWLWVSTSDAFLHGLCAAAVVLAVLLMLDVAPALCALLLWSLHLSFVLAGDVFLQFQWDSLLVETLALCVFVAPWRWGRAPRAADGTSLDAPPSRLARGLVWWLLLRFTLQSGLVKLTAGDPAWPDLTALTWHYWTQPLPHVISVWAHRLPLLVHQVSAAGMFFVELVVPLLIFMPRRLRHLAVWPLVGLQVVIGATGNYGCFNLLTIALCLLLVDDMGWGACGRRLRKLAWFRWPGRGAHDAADAAADDATGDVTGDVTGAACGIGVAAGNLPPWVAPRPRPRLQRVALAVFAPLVLLISAVQMRDVLHDVWPLVGLSDPLGAPGASTPDAYDAGLAATLFEEGPAAATRLLMVHAWPFVSVNEYGLFRVMTKERPEIIVQGSEDGETWVDYEFRWKPGRLDRPPAWVQPHMPRLDWRLWFEALRWEAFIQPLRGYQPSPWFGAFLRRLLEGEPAVLGLLASDPFDGRPPRAVRVWLYRYRFAAPDAADGAAWERDRYYPTSYVVRRTD